MNENDRKTLKLQLILMVAGILVIPGAVIGVYALIGRFHWNVITAAFLGAIVISYSPRADGLRSAAFLTTSFG